MQLSIYYSPAVISLVTGGYQQKTVSIILTTPNHGYLITPTLYLTWIDHHFFVLTYWQATVKENNITEAILEEKWCHYCKLTRCPVNHTVKRVVWPHNSLLLEELLVATNTHLPTIEGFMRELILQISFIIL